jgi:Ca2+-binding EF-hand superfamily protein
VPSAAKEPSPEPAAAPEIAVANNSDSPAEESSSQQASSDTTDVQTPLFATERVLLLAPINPLIIEFQLAINGRPHLEAMDRLVEDVLKAADTDSDGRPTWREVIDSKRFKYGQFGNLPFDDENDYKQIIERYDVDRDGAVDAGELPRFVTRNAGSARSFSVRGVADFRHTGGNRAPLWRLLDADEDGAISSDEQAAAAGRMLTRDTDDDEILLPGDVNPQGTLDPSMMPQRRRGGSTIIRMLGPHADWDSVRSSLEREYAGDGYLSADSFPLTPDLFTQLDKNKDGKLLKAEFPGLNDVPPHLVIAIGFGKEQATEAAPEQPGDSPVQPAADAPIEPAARPQLRLVSIAQEFSDAAADEATPSGRITIQVARNPLTLYVNDTVAGGDFDAQARQILTALDADKNGYLEEKEVTADAAPQLGQFAAVDADEDGKVYSAEIIAFLKQQQAGLRAQIHALASDRDDALFAALDQNHDERLDASEIEGLPQRLAKFDANGDSQITSDEIPESLVIGLARGNLENLDALFAPPPLIARAPAEGTPRWFTAMDANADGAISRREFLGPAEKFPSLDTSGDGLLDAAEAKALAPQ